MLEGGSVSITSSLLSSSADVEKVVEVLKMLEGGSVSLTSSLLSIEMELVEVPVLEGTSVLIVVEDEEKMELVVEGVPVETVICSLG